MEGLWHLVDRLQKSVASSAVHSLSTIDWIVLIAIFWGLVQGSRRGFSDMFGKTLAIFLASLLTMSLYDSGAQNLLMMIPALPLPVAQVFSFVLFGVCLWLVVSWCINVFGKLLKVEAQGILKTLGGMVMGVLRMLLLLSFFVQFLLLFPFETVQRPFKQGRTYTGYRISRVVPVLLELASGSFRAPAFEKSLKTHKVGE